MSTRISAGLRITLAAVLVAVVTSLALPTVALAQGQGRGPGMGPGGMMPGWGLGGLYGYGSVVLGAVADALGMTAAELSAELQGGATLSELAQARNISPDEIVSSVVNALSQLLDQQAAQGQLSQTQRQLLLAQLENQLRAQLDVPGFAGAIGLGFGAGFTGMYMHESPMLIQASRALGLDAAELVAQLQSGATIADLAEAQGVDLEADIIEPLLEPERARLQVMVEMEFITQAQADAELAITRSQLFCQAYRVGDAFGYGMGMGMGPGRGLFGGMRGWYRGMMGCPYCW